MELLDGMLQKDKDEFKRISNRLLSNCFICKGNQTGRSDYYFVLKHREKFCDFLNVLGYRLEINEECGVIQLTNPQNYNHLNLKLYESIILLILRILYDEKKRELSAVNEAIAAAIEDGSMEQFVAEANELASGEKYEGLLDENGEAPTEE